MPLPNMLFSLILMIAIFYFLTIRPSKKRMEQQKNMYDSLREGDHVITIGGLHGIIDEIDRTNNIVVLDCEGVYLTFELQSVGRVVSKPVEEKTNQQAVEELGSKNPPSAPEEDAGVDNSVEIIEEPETSEEDNEDL